KTTIELSESLSPSCINRRKRGAEPFGPVKASIRTDVSSWIILALSVFRRFFGLHEFPESRCQLRPGSALECGSSYDREREACAYAPLRSDGRFDWHSPEWPPEQ